MVYVARGQHWRHRGTGDLIRITGMNPGETEGRGGIILYRSHLDLPARSHTRRITGHQLLNRYEKVAES